MNETLKNKALTTPSLKPNWNDFERYLHSMNHTEQTIRAYKHKLKLFFIENLDALNYNYSQILSYFENVQTIYSNASTKDSILISIKKYYDYLIDRGIRDDHPCKTLYLKKRINKVFVSKHLFTKTELNLLLTKEERYEKLRLRNQALLSILIYQGLTSSELCYLKLQHINLDTSTIYVSGSKMLSKRYLPIYPEQKIMIENYLQDRNQLLINNQTNTLFIGFSGSAITVDDINYLVSTFKYLFPDRNLNPTTIRESVIYNLLNNQKKSLEQVQFFVGHKWISSTARYMQSSFEEERRLLNKAFEFED